MCVSFLLVLFSLLTDVCVCVSSAAILVHRGVVEKEAERRVAFLASC